MAQMIFRRARLTVLVAVIGLQAAVAHAEQGLYNPLIRGVRRSVDCIADSVIRSIVTCVGLDVRLSKQGNVFFESHSKFSTGIRLESLEVVAHTADRLSESSTLGYCACFSTPANSIPQDDERIPLAVSVFMFNVASGRIDVLRSNPTLAINKGVSLTSDVSASSGVVCGEYLVLAVVHGRELDKPLRFVGARICGASVFISDVMPRQPAGSK